MKNLLIVLLIAGVAGYFSYQYFVNGDNPLAGFFQNSGGALPSKDAQGRELVPCKRCLATGQITCTAHRCKEGMIPCSGPCLKLSDSGWQRMEGQDPNKLFMIYRVNGGTQGVSQAHVGEVFEIRFGEFYRLGICKVCQGRTTLPCKVCGGGGKVACTVCLGEKVVLKAVAPAAAAAIATAPGNVAEPVEPRPLKTFTLKNGKSITGTPIVRDGSLVWIRTAEGTKVELKASEIVSER